jgi:hypothetical protein
MTHRDIVNEHIVAYLAACRSARRHAGRMPAP